MEIILIFKTISSHPAYHFGKRLKDARGKGLNYHSQA